MDKHGWINTLLIIGAVWGPVLFFRVCIWGFRRRERRLEWLRRERERRERHERLGIADLQLRLERKQRERELYKRIRRGW